MKLNRIIFGVLISSFMCIGCQRQSIEDVNNFEITSQQLENDKGTQPNATKVDKEKEKYKNEPSMKELSKENIELSYGKSTKFYNKDESVDKKDFIVSVGDVYVSHSENPEFLSKEEYEYFEGKKVFDEKKRGENKTNIYVRYTIKNDGDTAAEFNPGQFSLYNIYSDIGTSYPIHGGATSVYYAGIKQSGIDGIDHSNFVNFNPGESIDLIVVYIGVVAYQIEGRGFVGDEYVLKYSDKTTLENVYALISINGKKSEEKSFIYLGIKDGKVDY